MSAATDSKVEKLFAATLGLNDEQVLSLADRLHDLIRARRSPATQAYRYAVLRCDDAWRVVCGRGRIGRFDDIDDALAFCRRLVIEAATSGRQVEFLVQDPCGQLRRVELDEMGFDQVALRLEAG